MSNPLLNDIRKSAGMRLAVLFGSFFILLLFSSIITLLINSLPGDARTHALCTSVVQSVLAFCIPAMVLSRFSSNDWKGWLKLTKAPPLKALAGVVIVYIISMPAMEWLIEWNSNLHLPASMSALEETLRKWEDTNDAASRMLLDAHGFLPVLAGVLVIGVLTGFSEELFFRGGLQGIFLRAGDRVSEKNGLHIALAVWMSALIFSTMHFQFLGFFPRLLMGVFFGYLLVWTRSIWVPVFAHILNNSVVVITAAISGDTSGNLIEYDPISPFTFSSANITVYLSIGFTVAFFIVFRNILFKSNQTVSWQKSQLPPVSER